MSGGMDSTACAHLFLCQGMTVDAIFVEYGQAAVSEERRAVNAITTHLGVPLHCLRLQANTEFSSGELTGRNAFLISTAVFATRGRSGLIGLGIHAGTPYYDCSEAFLNSINQLVQEQTNGKVAVAAPFLSWSKSDIHDYFRSTNLPLDVTYSCESGTQPPCGVCASCRDRRALGC